MKLWPSWYSIMLIVWWKADQISVMARMVETISVAVICLLITLTWWTNIVDIPGFDYMYNCPFMALASKLSVSQTQCYWGESSQCDTFYSFHFILKLNFKKCKYLEDEMSDWSLVTKYILRATWLKLKYHLKLIYLWDNSTYICDVMYNWTKLDNWIIIEFEWLICQNILKV